MSIEEKNKKNISLKRYYFLIILALLILPQHLTARDIGEAEGMLGTVAGKSGVAQTDVVSFAGTLIKAVISLVGLFFLLLMVYAGFIWMTSRGNEQRIEKAKETLKGAIIGIAVVVAAYGIAFYVIDILLG